ncbi:MAG: efflux transporter periplasmic adaptor subunit [Rhodobacterales bacterium]|nr:MAG: efflux transporter periplasmic adaptor subunit [Rhodobacterales bacterium]
MKSFKSLLFAAALVTGVALPGLAEQTAPARPVHSEIIGATAATARDFIGTVAARTEVDLGFPASGTITSRPVSLADIVQKGDVLAQLDPEALEAGAWAARAGVVIATQQLKSAQDAESREKILVERGVESQSRLQVVQRKLAAAKARLEQAKAALVRAEDLLDSATLRAPHDGVITLVLAESGASVSAGQPILRLAATDEREVVIDLSEEELALLPQNAVLDARLLAIGQIQAQIRLRSVDPVADTRTRTRRCHFSLLDAPAEFRIGALVLASPRQNDLQVMTIPLSAVFDENGASHVWLVSRPDGRAHKAAVTLGEVVGKRAIVLSGLQKGDEIITKGIHSIKEGQIVGPRVNK